MGRGCEKATSLHRFLGIEAAAASPLLRPFLSGPQERRNRGCSASCALASPLPTFLFNLCFCLFFFFPSARFNLPFASPARSPPLCPSRLHAAASRVGAGSGWRPTFRRQNFVCCCVSLLCEVASDGREGGRSETPPPPLARGCPEPGGPWPSPISPAGPRRRGRGEGPPEQKPRPSRPRQPGARWLSRAGLCAPSAPFQALRGPPRGGWGAAGAPQPLGSPQPASPPDPLLLRWTGKSLGRNPPRVGRAPAKGSGRRWGARPSWASKDTFVWSRRGRLLGPRG